MSFILYGAGGHARELRYELHAEGVRVEAFVDDFHHDRVVDSVPVLSFEAARRCYPEQEWLIAIGDPRERERIAKLLLSADLRIGSFVSAAARVLPTAQVGRGVQVFSNSVLSAAVSVGDFAIVNFGCVMSHDVKVGSFATIAPGVSVAGNVHIGRGTWVGVGATIKNGSPDSPLVVGDWCIIGAGACVVSDVEPGLLVAGVPAKPMKRDDE